ncbi:MAG: anaerobic ribonucleoside-triphosphate reductase activating protein [Candidatus Methanofastidiosia archaeon]
MAIKSFVEMSLADWDGKVSCVVFLGGCNYRCPFCHNWQIATDPDSVEDVKIENILDYLKRSSGWIENVVITGGEPTCDQDIFKIANIFKSLDLLVKVDTNGSNPTVLEELIDKNLVDFIAMDVKNSFHKYAETVGTAPEIENIKKSIEIVKSFPHHEFRTTVVPGLVEIEDLDNICSYINGAKMYVLQRFHPENVINKEFSELSPQSDEEMNYLKGLCSKHLLTKWRG